ncbi:MAG: tRNA lysidine(34) synthetase TilS, partial [Chloroflexota bacterium]|nr:tRNA lysidine(34) synthetase TilS [Chloroflexota bacterium]
MDDLRQRVLDFILRERLIEVGSSDEVLDGCREIVPAPAAGISRAEECVGVHGRGRVVIVGVSGGPDSVCLLHILDRLKESLGINLHIAHLNHMLRGAASDGDARYVEELAESLGIPATIETRDVASYRKEHRLSIEETARELRYDFFAGLAGSTGTGCVALGHTEDDQVETVLMHLVRGAGLAGLRGMTPVTQLRSRNFGELLVIRPLLEVAKSETEKYC